MATVQELVDAIERADKAVIDAVAAAQKESDYRNMEHAARHALYLAEQKHECDAKRKVLAQAIEKLRAEYPALCTLLENVRWESYG